MTTKKINEDYVKLISENQTRKKFIDKQLAKVGWKKTQWKDEVNSVKSNFKIKNYNLFDGTCEKGVDRFIDYLLLAQDNSPLAIIEAKKYSVNPKEGTIQARTYQEDIENQIGKRIPIFLTNGETWILIDQEGREREVRGGPFSQEDLERRNELFRNQKDPTKTFTKIVDRDKSVLNVKKLAEHFGKGHRSAFVQMATGTGKTRIAMAIIDILVKSNYIRNVLFIADRIALADQASADGFKKFFKEPVWELHRKGFNTTSRFYSSTVQTLMGKNNNRMVDKFSPGFFDLIVFDEAHRSQYDRNNYIHQYFDAMKVGLTATPREEDSKNTYELFDCVTGEPTVEYSYDDAVSAGVLVPYEPLVVETENLKLGIKGVKLTSALKDQLRKQEVDPDNTEFEGSQFEKVFLDEKTNEIIVSEFIRECYRSPEGLPCKTIFFCRSKKHADRMKKTFQKLDPSLSNHVQVIVSRYRSQDEVKRFKQKSEPRIALSVSMLDTGVDIPEVCNLVFIGPVYSPIRFWQMLGRGTRNFKSACAPGRHPEWLSQENGFPVKNGFLMLDFQLGEDNNVKLHHLNKRKEKKSGKDMISTIFDNRINLLKKKLTDEQKKIIVGKILNDINALNEESFIVREKYSLIKKLKGTFDLDKYIKELHEEIQPLMVMVHGKDPKVTPFILQVEKLFYAIITNKLDLIDKIKSYVQIRMENILAKETKINEIKAKKKTLIKVLREDFWEDLTFEKVEVILKELSPLMKYYEEERGSPIEVDKPDTIVSRTRFVYEIKEDPKMAEFIKKNPIVQKIKKGRGITCVELHELEKELSKLNSSYTIENIQIGLRKDFLIFLHEMIGLTKEYDPKEIIEREFNKYVIDHINYNSKQIEFLHMLKKVFANRKYIELKDFAKEPFKDENPVELFNGVNELKAIITKCQAIVMK
jgi:type I restriction enzyme, R subunit